MISHIQLEIYDPHPDSGDTRSVHEYWSFGPMERRVEDEVSITLSEMCFFNSSLFVEMWCLCKLPLFPVTATNGPRPVRYRMYSRWNYANRNQRLIWLEKKKKSRRHSERPLRTHKLKFLVSHKHFYGPPYSPFTAVCDKTVRLTSFLDPHAAPNRQIQSTAS